MNVQSLWSRLLSPFRRWRSVNVGSLPHRQPSCLFPHCDIQYRPKSLADFDYSAILCGEVGPENYSSDCWLEGHLHRFSSLYAGQRNVTNSSEDSASSCGVDETFSNFSGHSFTNSDASSFRCLYIYHYGQTDRPMDVEAPPPYWDEPPPSYEEATRIQVSERQSSSCSLTHVDHASDWMW